MRKSLVATLNKSVGLYNVSDISLPKLTLFSVKGGKVKSYGFQDNFSLCRFGEPIYLNKMQNGKCIPILLAPELLMH